MRTITVKRGRDNKTIAIIELYVDMESIEREASKINYQDLIVTDRQFLDAYRKASPDTQKAVRTVLGVADIEDGKMEKLQKEID